MAVATTTMDQAEYDRWASIQCPKVKRAQPWMHGDIRKALKVVGPKRADVKVAGADRKVYERCAAAMQARTIWSWKVDDRGFWMVQVVEGGDWHERLLRHQVAELLAELAGDRVDAVLADVVTEPAVAAAPAVAGSVPVVEVVAPVVAIDSIRRPVSAMPDTVGEYLARLVFEPKRQFAAALVAHLVDGAAAPADPGTEWADKVRVKLARLVPAAGRDLVAVAS